MVEKDQNKKRGKKSDLNVLAHKIVKEATKEKPESGKKEKDKPKK